MVSAVFHSSLSTTATNPAGEVLRSAGDQAVGRTTAPSLATDRPLPLLERAQARAMLVRVLAPMVGMALLVGIWGLATLGEGGTLSLIHI